MIRGVLVAGFVLTRRERRPLKLAKERVRGRKIKIRKKAPTLEAENRTQRVALVE